VLASVLPADFPHDVFEKLLGFWGSSKQIVDAEDYLNYARAAKIMVKNPHGPRAFRAVLRAEHLDNAHKQARKLWGDEISIIDPMAGGGSIPLESARLGFRTFANEYNPVACSVLEATVEYPFRFGEKLAVRARHWGMELRRRFNERMEPFYPSHGIQPVHFYVLTRCVPCPDTQYYVPLVSNWYLLKPNSGAPLVARPRVDRKNGTWGVEVVQVGRGAGQISNPPAATYSKGKGVSLFTGQQIDPDWIKTKAQNGEMRCTPLAVALRTSRGLTFHPPTAKDLSAIGAAEKELARLRSGWEKSNIIPMELIYLLPGSSSALACSLMSFTDSDERF
jgi:adenine-specific DNA methylase